MTNARGGDEFGDRFQFEAGAIWLFAYGSLMFRPGFEAHARMVASLRGYGRRFWQGSPDHRGTPEAPGRVVTLVELPGERCQGIAYLVPARSAARVFAELDAREQAGFVRKQVQLEAAPAGRVPAVAYVARPDNPHFMGPAPLPELAAHIRARRGQSGSNAEYLRRLASALREHGLHDSHVFELEAELERCSGA